jgi:branched-chain amino acid transport system substrate-binding protein
MNDTMKYLKVIACLSLLMVLILPCVGYPQAKDKIRIGNAIALSGPYVAGAVMTQANPYDMWVKEVNAKGGIYVKEYGKKLPIEMIRYDDKSDVGTAVKLVEKLILDDKVDLLLPPWSTGMNFAIAPIITKYEYPVLGVTVDSMKIKEIAPTIPYFFVHLNQPPVKAEAIVPLCKELGVKTAVVIHHADLHGIEFAGYVAPQLSAGIDAIIQDLSRCPIFLAAEKINSKTRCIFAFSYPDETFSARQAKAIGLTRSSLHEHRHGIRRL